MSPDDKWAVEWCRANNARVRFESDKTVSVIVNRTKRRRKSLVSAVLAVRMELGDTSQFATARSNVSFVLNGNTDAVADVVRRMLDEAGLTEVKFTLTLPVERGAL